MAAERRPDRPGGFAVTNRALELCAFPEGAIVLDVGCGSGATVEYLRGVRGFDARGFDAEASGDGPGIVRALAEALPVPDGCADGVLMECSLSVFGDPRAALEEAARVLRPGGALAVSTLYARGRSAYLGPRLGRAETAGELRDRVSRAGFEIEVLEDHSAALLEYWGQAVFDRGSRAACSSLGVDPGALRAAGCGYCLLVARRGGAG